MSDVAIRVNDLSKRYSKRESDSLSALAGKLFRNARSKVELNSKEDSAEFWALKDINFEIKKGEIVGIVGHNGAGKSTLLKVLSRITNPTSGFAEINGRVGMLLEVGTGFHPDLTGRENVFVGGAILGMTRQETLAKYQDIVDFAEIWDFMDMPVRHYSSGMNLRLALSVAIHLDADIIFLDEVWAVGDQSFQKKSLERIEKMIASGRTFVIVSHAQDTLRRLCSRCILLDHGQMVLDSNPAQVLTAYSKLLLSRERSSSLMPTPAGVDFGQQRNCRLCGHELSGDWLDLGSLPITNDFTQSPGNDLYPLTLAVCPHCSLAQLSRFPLPLNIIPRHPWIHYNEPTVHLGAVCERVLAHLPAGSRRVVGVGPFDPPLLKRLESEGLAVESWDLLADRVTPAGRNPYLETLQDVLSSGQLGGGASGRASALICRYLLEHCHDPRQALSGMMDALDEGGLLVIEVPDSQKFLSRKDYSFLWEEHACYFTEETFRDLLAVSGLDLVEFLRFPGVLEDAMVALCRKGAVQSAVAAAENKVAAKYCHDFREVQTSWQNAVRRLAGGRKIVVFGAGHQAVMFVNVLGLQRRIAYMVDDSPDKLGYIPPGMSTPIVGSEVFLADPDVSLCLLAVNPVVHDNLRDKFKSFTDRGGLILSLFPSGQGDTPIELPPPSLLRKSSEVFLAAQPVSMVGNGEIGFLRQAVTIAPRDRVRIDLHGTEGDPIHEMVIAIRPTSYIRPHKHPGKSKSFHIIEGVVDVVIFDDVGEITQVVKLDALGQVGGCAYRMSQPLFHTLVIQSPLLVVHEITTGPFVLNGSPAALFSPDEGDRDAVLVYMDTLRERVAAFSECER